MILTTTVTEATGSRYPQDDQLVDESAPWLNDAEKLPPDILNCAES